MAEVTELITRFSYEGSAGPLEDYNASLGRGIGLLAGMTAALVASTAAVHSWASGILQGIQPLVQLRNQTSATTQAIQELSFAAEVTDSTAETMQGTLDGLTSIIGEAAQKGSEDFARLGISVRNAQGEVKSADQVLLEVGERFRELNLSMAEQRSFAEALGIDTSLLNLLNRSRAEIRDLRQEARELGVLNDQQISQAQDYSNALSELNFGMEATKRIIAVGLAPEMRDLATGFTDLLKENKDWIIEGVQATVGVINDFIEALGRLMPVITAGVAVFATAKIASLGLSGALAAIFSPAVLIAGAIAGILLVVDDLIVAFRGGESAIADFFEEFLGFDIRPVLQSIVSGTQTAMDTARSLLTDLFVGIDNVADAIAGIPQFWRNAFNEAEQVVKTFIDAITEPFEELFNWIRGQFEWITENFRSIAEFLGFGGDEAIPGGPPPVGDTVRPGARAQNLSNTNVVEQNNNIEVRTDDAERAAFQLSDRLQRQLDDARTQSQRGGY